MEHKKQVSLIAIIGDYEISIGYESHFNFFRVLVRKSNCPKLLFVCKICDCFYSSPLVFEYEIRDGLILVSYQQQADYSRSNQEKKEIICRIPTDLIDKVAAGFNDSLKDFPSESEFLGFINLSDVPAKISGEISCRQLYIHCEKEAKDLSSWINHPESQEIDSRPPEESVISELVKGIRVAMNDSVENKKRRDELQKARKSYVHTDADKKVFLFCLENKYQKGSFTQIAVTEDGIILSYGGAPNPEYAIKSMKEHLYEYHWKYRVVCAKKDDADFIAALKKVNEQEKLDGELSELIKVAQ